MKRWTGRLAALSVLLVAAGLVPPGLAAAGGSFGRRAASATSVTVAVIPLLSSRQLLGRVSAASGVMVSGRLLDSARRGVPAQRVTVWAERAGTPTWAPQGTAVTNGTGAYHFTTGPLVATVNVQVRFSATAARAASVSAVRKVSVDPPPVGVFQASTSAITGPLSARMAASWRPGCPVPLSRLSYLTVSYRGFDGADHTGELVVATSAAAQIISVFARLYAGRYPIRSMRLVDDFGGSDDRSVDADNTSAFNCRPVTGGTVFSQHSYGLAIDVNTIENPYIINGQVLPPSAKSYAARPNLPGVIHPGDAVVTAFASIGWAWGGYWTNPKDYQHFSANGR